MIGGSDVIFTQRLDLDGTGLSFAVKDCIDVRGCRTTLGSRAFEHAALAPGNAEVVDNLVAAGARIAGKVTMHELAYGVTGINGWLGTPINPAFRDRVPGGSSSGSAAVVARGLVDFALGSDTGGSIRVPATCCQVVGLKPTFGLVSRRGVHPAASSLDCIGPIAGDVAMIARAMGMMVPSFVAEPPPAAVRIGWVDTTADADVTAAAAERLHAADVEVVPVRLPSLEAAFQAGLTVMAYEMAGLFGSFVGQGLLGGDVEARLQAAMSISPEQVESAEQARLRFTQEVDAALTGVDALAMPTLPAVPPLLADAGDAPRTLQMTALVRPFNLSGHPALSLPVLTADGLPAGLQLIGRHHADARLCAVSARIEGGAR